MTDGPGIVRSSNGETGDHNEDCACCGRGIGLEGEHTWKQCAELLAEAERRGIDGAIQREMELTEERDRLRSALQVAELRIAVALAECAPTQADRYNYSAKEHSELAARVRALRERAEGAEMKVARQGARNAEMLTSLAERTQERDAARAEATELRAEVERLRTDASIIEEALEFYAAPENWW